MVDAIQPNLLLITTDQERARRWLPADLRFAARDRLAARSVSFERCYATSVPCSPSRAVLYTGLPAPRTGVVDNVDFPWQDPLDPGVATVAHRLRAAGYVTRYAGKWHLGIGDPEPAQPGGAGGPSTTGRSLAAATGGTAAPTGPAGVADPEPGRNGAHGRPDLHATGSVPPDGALDRYGFGGWPGPDVPGLPGQGHRRDGQIAAEAAAWLRSSAPRTRPWFLAVNLVNPHDIMFSPLSPRRSRHDWGVDLPPSVADSLAGKPSVQRWWRRTTAAAVGGPASGLLAPLGRARWRWFVQHYVDLLAEVDAHLGTVLDGLDGSGQAGRTVVVWTSDHGELAGAHGLRGKGPCLYEENLRVPLTVSVPAGTPWEGAGRAGDHTGALCSLADVATTLVGWGGGDTTGMVGRDLRPVLADPAAPPTAVRDGLLVTVDATSTSGPPRLGVRGGMRGVITPEAKLGRYFRPGDPVQVRPGGKGGPAGSEIEVYDLLDDPEERHNLAPGRGRRVPLVIDLWDQLAELEREELAEG